MTDKQTRAGDWQRLGEYVVDRRVGLGYRKRPALAEASGISLRVLSDIELGKRYNYDAVTLASLEHTLNWATGSAVRITLGEEPRERNPATPPAVHDQPDVTSVMDDEALVKVMTSNLSDAKKRHLVRLLIQEREQDALRRAKRAEEMIHIFEADA